MGGGLAYLNKKTWHTGSIQFQVSRNPTFPRMKTRGGGDLTETVCFPMTEHVAIMILQSPINVGCVAQDSCGGCCCVPLTLPFFLTAKISGKSMGQGTGGPQGGEAA